MLFSLNYLRQLCSEQRGKREAGPQHHQACLLRE